MFDYDETEMMKHYLEMAKRGEWYSLPNCAPDNEHEIINAMANKWSFNEIFDDPEYCFLPEWLKSGLVDEYRMRDAWYDDYGSSEPEDFDYANNCGFYAEDSWAAYGDYCLDHD